MEAKDTKETNPGTELAAESAAEVSGGDGCTTTVTVGGISTQGGSPSEAMISIYEGAVDVTSHVIERVGNALK